MAVNSALPARTTFRNARSADPELTLGLPKVLTAATGMDAVAHCVETFISPVINPPAEGIAFEGLRRAMGFIERAVADGSDREARWEMMMAAMMGAMSFQKGLGAVHAISHPLGGMQEPRLHHGTWNAVVMPAVLRFNAGYVGDKYNRLKDAMGLDARCRPSGFHYELQRETRSSGEFARYGRTGCHRSGYVRCS